MTKIDFDNRAKTISYEGIKAPHYLGNYKRELAVTMPRMIENAYDWEHLPYVHPSSFAAIEEIDSGTWGWIAKTTLPGNPKKPVYQHIELLVDRAENYWATTVLDGLGEGMQIHTQATTLNETTIEVDVRFYLPEKPDDTSFEAAILSMLQAQYKTLYDEDLGLMQGRQEALNRQTEQQESPDTLTYSIADLETSLPHIITHNGKRFCLNRWQGNWVIYAADCPHLLGPLEHSPIDENGTVTCPWHGYKFNIINGNNCNGKPYRLNKTPVIRLNENYLHIAF